MISNPVAIARLALLIPLVWLLTDGGKFHAWAGLMVYAACGLGGLAEGYLPRWRGRASRSALMLHVLADRLLTVVVVAGLIAGGLREGLVLVASLILIARDVVLATLNESLPHKLDIKLSGLEKGRMVLQLLGFCFLIAPNFPLPEMGLPSHYLGGVILIVAAILAIFGLVTYARRAAAAFRAG